jgi:hypothetical protein
MSSSAKHHPTTLLAKLLEPVGRCLTPDVARELVNLRVDLAVQERLDELADKSTEGTLTNDERAEYETYVHALNFISVLQAQARRLLKNTLLRH